MFLQYIINLFTTGSTWPRLGTKFYKIIYRSFWMETEANAICTWFHIVNSVSSFLNEGTHMIIIGTIC